MVTIRPFAARDLVLLGQVMTGYTSSEKFAVSWHESPEVTSFQLELITLLTPYVKRYEPMPPEYYHSMLDNGTSLAACAGDRLIGVALGEVREWNRSFWLDEFHIQGEFQGQGIGRTLMDAVKEIARVCDCRQIVCETQNTNVPAIRFYRRMGFQLEALDLSLYGNQNYPDGEIALFMKYRF